MGWNRPKDRHRGAFACAVLTLCFLFSATGFAQGGAVGHDERVLERGPETTAPVVVAPRSAGPGDIVRVMVRNAVPPAVVELRNGEGGTITAGEPIAMAGVQEWRVAVYLLGVDSTTHPGDYVIVGMNTAGAIAFAQPLEIVERDFRSEEIPLTPSLTSLRDEPDPRKTEQTRVLTELILSRDPDAVFHTGPLGWPLPPETRRTSLYGDRRTFLYADGRRARAIHVGLDFASPVGTTVVSSGSGVVRMARDRIVTGKTVVIEHLPGVYSLYYHLDELAVEEGRTISQGDVVGTVGATGLATGPHLHWEVRVGGVAVSPEAATESPLLLVWPVR